MVIMMTEVMQYALNVFTHVPNVLDLPIIVLYVFQEQTEVLLQIALVIKVIKKKGLFV